jgi:hypothetical protein
MKLASFQANGDTIGLGNRRNCNVLYHTNTIVENQNKDEELSHFSRRYKVREEFRESIMILSQPLNPFLVWTSTKNPSSQYPTDPVEPWCFSHWPGAYCFITHHCASTNQKGKLIENYDLPDDEIGRTMTIKPMFIEL